ncbi:MAG: ABC transporter permease [candidate division WOR-3 bacterium]
MKVVFPFKRFILSFLEILSEISYTTLYFFSSLKYVKKYFREIVYEIYEIGHNSLLLVIFTSSFVGMVATIQTAYQIKDYVPVIYIGSGVAKACMIELGPVITGLVVAGRISSGIAAELGTMVVTEQIDALNVMGINPYRFLVMPRIVGGIISLPLLTSIAILVAIFSGMFIANLTGVANYFEFSRGTKMFFLPKDLFGGLLKSMFFGYALTLSGAIAGLSSEKGAEGVGKATTKAVVLSSILILVLDYILGILIFG